MAIPHSASSTAEQATPFPSSPRIAECRSSHTQIEEDAEQVLVRVRLHEVAAARVDSKLRGRKPGDEPAPASVDGAEFQDIPEEEPVPFGVPAVEEEMRP